MTDFIRGFVGVVIVVGVPLALAAAGYLAGITALR